ncbi:MAG TPA: hypothetical protein VJS45_10030 [Acidimicrobiia bacterium]|nr:hypothetical protein [Acidimicrobiia bacterium]
MGKYLIVANQTLATDQLTDKVRQLCAEGPCTFHVVVPATHAKDHAFHTEGHDHALAEKRLEAALVRFRDIGATADGEVGDTSAFLAVRDCLLADGTYDGVIVSTLPLGVSRWLRQDLPHRLERTFGLPVTVLTGQYEAVS